LGKRFLKFILDTHILVWWLRNQTDLLTKPQLHALAETERLREPAALSAMSLWELAMMIDRKQLVVTTSLNAWLEELENHPLLTILPLTARIAAESVQLVGFHRDPADRIIVASARQHGLNLLTADHRIRKWGNVKVV
jgi:PIN domain nuclease of toxin-antitoxin system